MPSSISCDLALNAATQNKAKCFGQVGRLDDDSLLGLNRCLGSGKAFRMVFNPGVQ